MSSQQQDQHWNTGASEIQQPGGPDQRQSIEPQPTWLKGFSLYWVWDTTRRRAVKQGNNLSTVIGLTTKHALCRIAFVVASSFKTKDYFSKSFRATIFLNLYTLSS